MFKTLLTLLLIASALFDSVAPEGEAPTSNLNPFFRFFNAWKYTALCVFDGVALTCWVIFIIWLLVRCLKKARRNVKVAQDVLEEAEPED
ncbi:hypothetical protein P8452_48220 [Trifolium repens]|nr:hypothetical protein P8452_48220 [Trifolium repens]